ncbi:isochorismatase family protein [Streptomonospora sp. S1-112]|uniref:Isochorismatase family protein n=1 Tax=Streptomonospora mangrovi TaxID=2883123 RepID=A0A9X3NKU2_9ACTN|nr:isochorismatase family protein [Streptomonospora mangrovi]MDA0563943.1 isochorismatase family protein [Streptomonospora mangrovi]
MPAIPPISAYPMPTAGELPANTADWTLEPHRAVLLVHDMQRFFLRPFASAPALRDRLVENCGRLRDRCAELGVPVAYTAQPGGMTPDERGLLRDFWGPGMDATPEDRAVVDRLAPRDGDWLLTKWRYSAFHRTGLLERMRAQGRDQLLVCGVYAHVGILMSCVDAFTNDVRVFLAADAVADFAPGYHRLALDYTAQRCGMVHVTADLLAALEAHPAGAGRARVAEEVRA